MDSDGFVLVKDLVDVLLSYVSLSNKASTSNLLPSDELKKAIPGIETMSPRTRTQNVVEWYKREFITKKM